MEWSKPIPMKASLSRRFVDVAYPKYEPKNIYSTSFKDLGEENES
jgi:hypothetical protein